MIETRKPNTIGLRIRNPLIIINLCCFRQACREIKKKQTIGLHLFNFLTLKSSNSDVASIPQKKFPGVACGEVTQDSATKILKLWKLEGECEYSKLMPGQY